MRKLVLAAVAGAMAWVCAADVADNPTLRIMPLGDSITYGACSALGGGYRAPLWTLLRNGNYNVDFVGTQTNNPRKDGSLGDVDHEGHSGWKLSSSSVGVYENINAWFSSIRDPHVILLHLGTNDTGDGETTFCSTATNRLERLLDRIHECQPSAKIIVTTLLRRIGSDSNVSKFNWISTSFNPFIEGVVASQRAKGQDAYYLDMCSAVTDDGLDTDGLHPNDTGYSMMADAWYAKIQEIIADPAVCGGVNQPAVVHETRASAASGMTYKIFFNQPMNAAQLADAARWTVTGTTAPWTVTAGADGRAAVFTFAPADFGRTVTVSAASLAAEASADAVCAVASRTFTLIRPLGIENNISAAARAGYELVYDLAIPARGTAYRYNNVAYSKDRHRHVSAFSRIAYYFELQKSGEDVQYVWASMDAFTDDAGKIGVPTAQSGARFQQDVANLFIESNVAGLRTNQTIPVGNIEFWPDSYKTANKRGLAGADASKYDLDDTPDGVGSHYGSMQLHDTAQGAASCVFGWNKWSSGTDTSDLGLGAYAGSQSTDWTFAANSASYAVRNMQVYVLPAPATEPPTVVSATRDAAQRRITVTFSMPVAEGNLANCFALKGGRVTRVTRDPDNASVVWIDYLPAAGELEVTVSGVHEASSALLAMTGPVTVKPEAGGLPEEITSVVDAALTQDYDVLYQVDIPATHVNWLTAESGHTDVPYTVKREDYPVNVDRVAYFMELRGSSGCKWVWVSMDAFSPDVKKFGVPISADRAVKQMWVKNMDVASNVGGIVTGTGMDGGFIEFWHMNYGTGNALNIPGASASTHDFGDTMNGSGNYGCMQVHSVTNKQTIFAFNNFGKNNSSASCIGIGNDTYKTGSGTHPDWTFHYTAGDYTSRRLWVLVRPGAAQVPAAPVPEEVVENVPEAADFSHLYTLTLPAENMAARTNYVAYHTVDNRAKFTGAKASRVAYYLELVKANGQTNWCWTAFNNITEDLERYSLPTNFKKIVQQRVANLDVRSNVPGVTEVTGSNTGNIEFFPGNYEPKATLGLQGASGDQFDWDDTAQTTGAYGCMQVHNWGAKQTCWGVSHLNTGKLDVGIGNSSTTKTDWTQTYKGGDYTSRRLLVFLKFDESAQTVSAPPALRRIVASRDVTRLCVEFATEPSTEWDGAIYEIATVRTGATVKEVRRSPFDPREYILTLTRPLESGTNYTLKGSVSRAGGDVTFQKGFTTPADTFAAPSLTAENVPELADYRLVNEYAFGSGSVSITANGADYSVDESRFGVVPFDRVAYFFELVGTNGVTQWVWASMDAFTTDAAKLGLPTVQRGNFFQRYVDNLTVRSGASGADGVKPAAVAGTFDRGNIEFFTSNYTEVNSLGVPGANGGTFDFGDKPEHADGLHAGHGCFQIHDYLNQRTVMAINRLNGPPEMGIGTDTFRTAKGLHPDWTHHATIAEFASRRFYVFVRPTATSTGAAFDREPEDATVDVGAASQLVAHAPGAVSYTWLVDGVAVAGCTGPVLDLPPLAEGAHTVQSFAVFADGTQTAGRTATVTVAWPDSFVSPTIRIMPLGDSITHGVVGGGGSYQGGYRQKLWEKMTAAGYNVDFVGSQTVNSSGMVDPNHEGHSGWWTSHDSKGLYENILGWFKGILNPHVVLVHIGTNDTGDSSTFPKAIDRLDALVERIAEAQPGAVIVVSTLLERGANQYSLITKHFNPFVRERVLAHQLKGRKVRFLDMNAYVPLSDMPDSLHPNEAGYEKMAQGWFDAITEFWPTAANVEPDNTPGILTFTADQNTRKVCTLVFNTPLDVDSATNTANWAIDGVAPASVTLSADGRTATATAVSALAAGAEHEIAYEGLMDAGKTSAAPRTTRTFFISIPQGLEHYVPASERAGYEKVYELEIPAAKIRYDNNAVKYAVDNHLSTRPFSRVAYYLELRRPNQNLQYVWVSMDAFTDDAGKIGIPTKVSGAVFQQKVTNLYVASNVEGVRTGEIAEGNIEFWPTSYEKGGTLGLPGANSSLYDFDDKMTSGGYGSFQVHDFLNKSTIFAFNRWTSNDSAQDLGIGSNPLAGVTVTSAGAAGADWTFMLNSAEYEVRHLEVWALTDVAHATPPVPLAATRAPSGRQVTVTFDENLAAGQDLAGCFTMSDGTPVAGATQEGTTVRLAFETPVASENLQVTVRGVRDDSAQAVAMPAPVTLDVDCAKVPADVVARLDAETVEGFQLIYDLNVPLKGDWNAKGDAMYDLDDARFFEGGFDRVAYLFELVNGGATTQYVWTAMDAFTPNVRRLGIPLKSKGYIFQQMVSNLDVKSNVSSITSGSFENGNIEFWPSDYNQANAAGVPNANAGTYDFGDARSNESAGYGSFQVHNAGEKQVLFAINHWGSDGNAPCVGIGNQPYNTSNLDWTFADNAGNFVSRRLRVFVRPAAVTACQPAPDEVVADVPDAVNFEHLYTVEIPVKPEFSDAASNTACHVVNNQAALAQAYGAAPKRVAYYLELVKADGTRTWAWTAFDAFTSKLEDLSIPRGGFTAWQRVTNLDVRSNVAGVTQGERIATGNIEFTSYNYTGAGRLGLPDATTGFDFDDSPSSTGAYGSMQVHNWGAKSTIWAVNAFNGQKEGDGVVCVGIGNSPSGEKDWTHTFKGGEYVTRRLHVFARWNLADDASALSATPRRALANAARTMICVSFDSAVQARLAALENFSCAGADLVSAQISPVEPRDVLLTLGTPLAADAAFTLVFTDPGRQTAENLAFRTPAAARPAVLANVAEAAEYELVNMLPIGTSVAYSHNGADYRQDESRFRPAMTYDRIAYCLELVGTNGVSTWAWTSMDAFTTELSKVGVPTVERDGFFQQYVENLHVEAGASSGTVTVTPGDYARGNIEFWPGNYSEGNQKNIPDASGAAFDFGDTANSDAHRVGYGSMQVHVTDKKETAWAFNSFGSSTGVASRSEPGLGVGNYTKVADGSNAGSDWTHVHNARSYSVRNLYVLVRPCAPVNTSSSTFQLQPRGGSVVVGGAAPQLTAYAIGATGYQWLCDGEPVLGATASWLKVPTTRTGSHRYQVIANFADGTTALSDIVEVNVFNRGTVIMFR